MFANYKAQLQDHQNFNTKYQVFKQLNESTNNNFYVIKSRDPGNSQVYILKHHQSLDGYSQQKMVFALQAIYGNYFVDCCDELKYTIVKYSEIGSLMDLGMRIKIFSFNSAKFYIYTLLSELRTIYQSLGIPFRTLYHTDLIYANDARLMISGFGKYQHKISEKQLIYDCGQILYYMITNSIFPNKAIKKKGQQKNRFLKPEFWDDSKKGNNHMKYMPSDTIYCKKWLKFFYKLTVQSEVQPTLANILGDQFFNQTVSFEVASDQIKLAVLSSKTKEKERDHRNFKIKAEIDRLTAQYQMMKNSQQRSTSPMYQIVQSPFLISLHQHSQNQELEHDSIDQEYKMKKNNMGFRKRQNNNQKKYLSEQIQQIGEWVCKFFEAKLDQSIDSDVIFQQSWIRICKYDKIQTKLSQKKASYEFKLYFKYFQEGDINCDPQQEFQKFQIQVFFSQNKMQNERCLKSFQVIKVVDSLHQILFQKLQHYLTEGLLQSFIFSK